jgi:hypothetical protein
MFIINDFNSVVTGMDVSTTTNIIIGCTLTFVGAVIIFGLGLISGYVRTIKNDMKNLLLMAIEHKTEISTFKGQIKDIYEKIYKLNREN